MSSSGSEKYLPVLFAGLGGFAVGVGFLIVAFLTSFGMCALNPSFAEVLFPYSRLVGTGLNVRGLFAFLLAFFQYPLYGIALGALWIKYREEKFWLLVGALTIIAAHGTAIAAAG